MEYYKSCQTRKEAYFWNGLKWEIRQTNWNGGVQFLSLKSVVKKQVFARHTLSCFDWCYQLQIPLKVVLDQFPTFREVVRLVCESSKFKNYFFLRYYTGYIVVSFGLAVYVARKSANWKFTYLFVYLSGCAQFRG